VRDEAGGSLLWTSPCNFDDEELRFHYYAGLQCLK